VDQVDGETLRVGGGAISELRTGFNPGVTKKSSPVDKYSVKYLTD
jgi:hypothetical protein